MDRPLCEKCGKKHCILLSITEPLVFTKMCYDCTMQHIYDKGLVPVSVSILDNELMEQTYKSWIEYQRKQRGIAVVEKNMSDKIGRDEPFGIQVTIDNDTVVQAAVYVNKPSNRCQHFLWVAASVVEHIEQYTVPQYGDYPNDQATEFSDHDIVTNMKRYLNRADSNARGPEEAQRDLLKVIHYAAILYHKRDQRATSKLGHDAYTSPAKAVEGILAGETDGTVDGTYNIPAEPIADVRIGPEPCPGCNGTGYAAGGIIPDAGIGDCCDVCQGTGTKQAVLDNPAPVPADCPNCNGTGYDKGTKCQCKEE